GVEHRAGGLDRRGDDRGQLDPTLAQLELAARDARYVQKIVEQPAHVLDLTIDDLLGPSLLLAGSADLLAHGERVADGGQGVAQLVGEDGEKLVLAAVGFAQRLVSSPALGDIARDLRGA